MVFGKRLINAQRFLLEGIPGGATVMIVGGGTGWILEEIAKVHPSGLTVTYIDASAKMTALAQQRNAGNNKVNFITAPVETTDTGIKYDVVITPFFFDNFNEDTSRKIFAHIDRQLGAQGIWLYCDFLETKVLWQRAVLKLMYVFFRLFCGIEAARLPGIKACFSDFHYKVAGQKTFVNGFVEAQIYERA